MGIIKFSILIANYNNAKYIRECLESILNQNYSNVEVILIDDASTDNSIEIIKEYSSNFSNIFYYKNENNQGAGYTKKRCIDLSTGEICGFVDPDDKLLPEAILNMVEAHEKFPNASLIYSQNIIWNSEAGTEFINPWVKKQPENIPALHRTFISHFATFKRSFYDQSLGMDPSFKRAVDHDLYYCLEAVGDIEFIDKPMYLYRQHSGGISLNDNVLKAEYWDWIVKHRHAQARGLNMEDEYSRHHRSRMDDLLFEKRLIRLFKKIFKVK